MEEKQTRYCNFIFEPMRGAQAMVVWDRTRARRQWYLVWVN